MSSFSYKIKDLCHEYYFSEPQELRIDIQFTVRTLRSPWVAFFLGEKEDSFQVRGSGTVWHHYPSGRRLPTGGIVGESTLAQVYTAYEYFKAAQ